MSCDHWGRLPLMEWNQPSWLASCSSASGTKNIWRSPNLTGTHDGRTFKNWSASQVTPLLTPQTFLSSMETSLHYSKLCCFTYWHITSNQLHRDTPLRRFLQASMLSSAGDQSNENDNEVCLSGSVFWLLLICNRRCPLRLATLRRALNGQLFLFQQVCHFPFTVSSCAFFIHHHITSGTWNISFLSVRRHSRRKASISIYTFTCSDKVNQTPFIRCMHSSADITLPNTHLKS